MNGNTGLGRSARSVLDRNTAGEDTSALFLGLVRQAGGEWDANLAPRPSVHSSDPAAGAHRRHSPWLDIRHKASVIAAVTVTVGGLYLIQQIVWPVNSIASGPLATAWSWMSLLWLTPLLPAVCELAGLLMYRHTRWSRADKPIPQLVCWRIVSRGTNTDALATTIRRCRAEMRASPMFRYIIEVVTDVPNPGLPAPASDLAYLTVPPQYRTPNGSLFKARALQYALDVSPLADTAWIIHLDEETHPTASGIKGAARMISEEESSGRLRIGQGVILYHRSWKRYPFLTLADMARTGDDFGRFHFAHRTGRTIFGMHGSWIVVRNDVEKAAGFDFGPDGSITEDAFWALASMEAGSRCRWVHGYMEEQSTQSVMDFLKQRRRWFQGIVKVCLYAPARWRWRAALAVSTVLWALSPVVATYTIAHFVTGGYVSPLVRILADGTLAAYIVAGLAGLRANLTEHGIRHPLNRIRWCAAWLICLPIFSGLESAAVAYALIRPANDFHVVRK
jgi:beta-1,4-mannosyltransferase